MIDKQLRCKIAQCKPIISSAESLHIDSCTIRYIKSGSKLSISCIGGTYKLLSAYPPSPQLVNLTCPSPYGEGFLFSKAIVFYLLTKVDRQMSRGSRDKCPV